MLTILLPAYNEAAGLDELLQRIDAVSTELAVPARIVLVDDGSTDNTSEVARRAAIRTPLEILRHERNRGLGCALRTGLLASLSPPGFVVTMDADGTHEPRLIPAIVAALEAGSDLVIASRFQPGGREVGVPAHRRALSRAARVVTGSLFRLNGIRDCTSGFRGYRTELLVRLADEHGPERLVEERGFACMLEVLLKAVLAGAAVRELPLVLRYDRKASASRLRIAPTLARSAVVLGTHAIRSRRRLHARARRTPAVASPASALLAGIVPQTSSSGAPSEMVSIVIPVRNERDSLPHLLERFEALDGGMPRPFRILVVDGASSDGTRAAAESFRARLPLEVLALKTDAGLGGALDAGLRRALEQPGPIVTMDGDDSHDPACIQQMLDRLRNGADVVIASRFQAGGEERGVAAHRRLLSHAASLLLRSLFPVGQARDYSSGFRAYRPEALLRLERRHGRLVAERGFSCMLALLLELRELGARVSEVPLVLRYDRKRSASKMDIPFTVRRYAVLIARHATHTRALQRLAGGRG